MAVHFHSLRIKQVKKETADCVSISFEVPDNLKPAFEFTQGQNITLKTTIDGEELRRSYSICSAPYENELKVAVKKVAGGKFSTYANEILSAGMQMDVLSPTGKFYTVLHPQNKKSYVAFAAGSGITPVLSIIKTALSQEPASVFTLVYCNKNRQSIIFFEELEALKNKYMHRFQFIPLLSRETTDNPAMTGRIDKNKLTTLGKLIDYNNTDEFFICGPEEMIFCVKDFLEQCGIEKKKIHFELFATTRITKQYASEDKISNPGQTKSSIQLHADGHTMNFVMDFNGYTILDAAIQLGAELPFACKGGMCCTCKAKLLEGKVRMHVHWGLEDEEVEKGYILTCQSHPLTEKVVVDFDAR